MTNRHLLPLEELLKEKSHRRSDFPQMEVDYFERYISILNELDSKVYSKIDAGLAANSGVVNGMPGYYTAHDKNHFNEVIRYAGQLLGVSENNQFSSYEKLKPFEIYILLVAIRIHDAGNIYGRDGHEKGCYRILTEAIQVPGDLAEKKEIANIARAHGGRVSPDDKDTIGVLGESKALTTASYRPRLLASIVRFADEICETNNRASEILLNAGKLPKHSEIYHAYAKSIVSVIVKNNPLSIDIEYQVERNAIKKRWGCEPRETKEGTVNDFLLIEEIFDRLEKMDRERKYCNRFSRALYSVESIRAKLDIVDEEYEVIAQIPIPPLEDNGYPENSKTRLKEQLAKYCTEDFGRDL